MLGLPPVGPGPLPGYLLIADRQNNRAIIVSPSKQIVWQAGGLRGVRFKQLTFGAAAVHTGVRVDAT